MSNKSSEKEDKDAAAFTVNNSDQDLYGGTYHSSRKVHWYRSTLWQTIVVGVASFLAPGVYNALAATGAGGLADVSRPMSMPCARYQSTDMYRSTSAMRRRRWHTPSLYLRP